MEWSRWKGPAATVGIIAIATLLCGVGLGANGLATGDEISHVQVAAGMAADGRWFDPHLFGSPYFNKPLPALWLIAAIYRVAGVSVFASRIWSALFAIASVGLLQLLGNRLYGKRAGAIAALALATSYTLIFVHGARTANFDTMMVCAFVLTSYLFVRAADSGRGWVVCAIAAGTASWAKNFAGFIPALVCVSALAFGAAKHRPTRAQWRQCAIAFAAVQLAWMIPVVAVWGMSFLEIFVGDQILTRVVRARPPLGYVIARYLGLFLFGFFPWSLVASLAVVPLGMNAWRNRDLGDVLVTLWLVVMAIVLLVSMPLAYNWYVMPVLPFAALCAARLLASDERDDGWSGLLLVVAIAATVLMPATPTFPFAIESYALPRFEWPGPVWLLFSGLVVTLLVSARSWLPPRRMVVVFGALALAVTLPAMSRVRYTNVLERGRGDLEAVVPGAATLTAMPYQSVIARMAIVRTTFNQIPELKLVEADTAEDALARAHAAPPPSYVLLSERGAGPYRWQDHPPGQEIFSGAEPDPFGGAGTGIAIFRIR